MLVFANSQVSISNEKRVLKVRPRSIKDCQNNLILRNASKHFDKIILQSTQPRLGKVGVKIESSCSL